MRIALLPAALAALVAAGAAGEAPAVRPFAPVPGFERAEGAAALAADPARGRLAAGDARGVWLREADGRVRRALGSGPVLDLAFTPDGALLAATARGLYEVAPDGRVRRRALGPGKAGHARRVLPTPAALFVASEDGVLAALPHAPFRPLDGMLPDGETSALAWTPEGGGAGRLWAIVAGDLYGASLESNGAGLRAVGFAREALAAQGGAPLDLVSGVSGELIVLQRSAVARRTSRGFETLPLVLPPGVLPVRLAVSAERAWIASDGGLLEAPSLAGPWRRADGAAHGAPASAVVATAARVFAATTRGIFAADLTGAPPSGAATGPRLPASRQAAQGAAPSEPETSEVTSAEEPTVGAVQRAALRYLELGSTRLAGFRRRLARRGLLPELSIAGDYGGFRAYDLDQDDTVFASGDRYLLRDRLDEHGRDFGVGAVLRWDLGDTVYNFEEVDISREVRELIELRDEVLDEVNQLYFERRRVLLERSLLPDPASPEAERLALRARELAAGLDAWTGGWWSRQVEPLSPRVTDPEEERP
jgi:hypothetical protein